MNIGKYMAAARGSPNVASSGAAESALRASRPSMNRRESSLAGIRVDPNNVSSSMIRTKAPVEAGGSGAGYDGGKSAWIQPRESGYKKRAVGPEPFVPPNIQPFIPQPPQAPLVTDLTGPKLTSSDRFRPRMRTL